MPSGRVPFERSMGAVPLMSFQATCLRQQLEKAPRTCWRTIHHEWWSDKPLGRHFAKCVRVAKLGWHGLLPRRQSLNVRNHGTELFIKCTVREFSSISREESSVRGKGFCYYVLTQTFAKYFDPRAVKKIILYLILPSLSGFLPVVFRFLFFFLSWTRRFEVRHLVGRFCRLERPPLS